MSDLETRVGALEARLAASLDRESRLVSIITRLVARLDDLQNVPLAIAEIEADHAIARREGDDATEDLSNRINEVDSEAFNCALSSASEMYRLKQALGKSGYFDLEADLRWRRDEWRRKRDRATVIFPLRIRPTLRPGFRNHQDDPEGGR